jgi:LacI family transcriptional regulator, xylobiose transport system transcriptional regulator
MGNGSRVTIASVADAAGVSVPTVSKVVNGRADVAPETRERVERVLHEQGYRRRALGRDARAALLDVVFNELESPWAMEIVKGVEEVARENGLGVVLSAQEGPGALGRSWVDAVAARRSAGLILVVSELTGEQVARLTARNIPFVVVDPAGEPAPGVPAVGATNWNGGLTATRHLIELGHRRIGMIGGPPAMLCSRARVDGYRAALETAGLPVDQGLIRAGDFHHEAGYRLGLELLGRPDRPTAVFAGNDLQALGLYEAARELGLRIPEDLSVVGFDDLPVARWVGPPLTTVRQPLTEMAEAAAKLVLDLGRAEGTPAATRVELATSLVVRASTGAPSGA